MEKMKEMPPSQFEEVDAEWEEYLNKKALSRSESEEGDNRVELTEEEKAEKKVRALWPWEWIGEREWNVW